MLYVSSCDLWCLSGLSSTQRKFACGCDLLTETCGVTRAHVGTRLRGATAVALMQQDSGLSAVDAVLRSCSALKRKLSHADVSSLRADEANSVLEAAQLLHRLVLRANSFVYNARSSQRQPSGVVHVEVTTATVPILPCVRQARLPRV